MFLTSLIRQVTQPERLVLFGTVLTTGAATVTGGAGSSVWSVRFRNYCYRLMTRLQEAIGLGLVLGVIHGLLQPAYSVPVVPNFTQSSMTEHTETTSKITETINSMDYNTGYQYSATGSGVTASGKTFPQGQVQLM